MRTDEMMTRDVKHCCPQDSLSDAARILWEHDCGCTPVLDSEHRLCGILTDRDICMAAYTSGRTLHDLKVADIMTQDVVTLGPDASLQDAEQAMRTRGVRRLPVIDEQRRLLGVLSCNDLCRWVDDGGSNTARHHHATHLVRTLATIGRSRGTPADASPASKSPTRLERIAPLATLPVAQLDAARSTPEARASADRATGEAAKVTPSAQPAGATDAPPASPSVRER